MILAALAGISLGAVVGPEAPLIALGGGLGYFVIGRLRADAPPELADLVAACGTFAAVSFLFGSPLIAAVLLIEATGLGGKRLPLLMIPGLLAAGIGMLVSIGLGSWTGVETSDIAITADAAVGVRPPRRRRFPLDRAAGGGGRRRHDRDLQGRARGSRE